MTNTVVTAAATALKAIAAEPEAAQAAQVAHTVEATSGWLADFTAIVDKVGGYVWGAPLITCILVTGLVLTCILRFTHLFNLKEAFRIMFSRDEGEGANELIVKAAFNPSAFTGGMVGTIFVAMQKGVARGIFSNEAGLGSAPIAAAGARPTSSTGSWRSRTLSPLSCSRPSSGG